MTLMTRHRNLSVACPKCKARKGTPCITPSRRKLHYSQVHASRIAESWKPHVNKLMKAIFEA